jgi:thiol-disulfide isomerase/thioredoxin
MCKFLIALLLACVSVSTQAAYSGELLPFKRGSWEEIRRASNGKPMIAHFWGLTCGPCRVEMPEWGRLLAVEQRVRVVVIHADPLPNSTVPVQDMLAATGLQDAENWVFDDSFRERLRFEIDPKWRGELPRTLLISTSGEVTALLGSADMAVVRHWIDINLKVSP